MDLEHVDKVICQDHTNYENDYEGDNVKDILTVEDIDCSKNGYQVDNAPDGNISKISDCNTGDLATDLPRSESPITGAAVTLPGGYVLHSHVVARQSIR
jgi:hypothetical protein